MTKKMPEKTWCSNTRADQAVPSNEESVTFPSIDTTPFLSMDLSNSDTLLFPNEIFDEDIISLIGLAIVLLRTSNTILSSFVRFKFS